MKHLIKEGRRAEAKARRAKEKRVLQDNQRRREEAARPKEDREREEEANTQYTNAVDFEASASCRRKQPLRIRKLILLP